MELKIYWSFVSQLLMDTVFSRLLAAVANISLGVGGEDTIRERSVSASLRSRIVSADTI